MPNRRNSREWRSSGSACMLAAAARGYSLADGHSGVLNACSIMVPGWHVLSIGVPCSDAAATHCCARGVVKVIGTQLSELECGWTTVDFVGRLRATDEVAPKPRAAAARRLVLRLSRCSPAPCLAALRIVHSRSLVVRCFGLSIRPLSVAASLAALTLTPSLLLSPSPLCLSPLPLLPLPPSSLTPLSASGSPH